MKDKQQTAMDEEIRLNYFDKYVIDEVYYYLNKDNLSARQRNVLDIINPISLICFFIGYLLLRFKGLLK